MCSFAETTHTPQGDGNKALEILKFCNVDEILFTPQGDGNSHHSGRMLIKTGNNPHPARGRKLGWCLLGLRGAAWKQPTPRKGTETQGTDLLAVNLRNNPHPARGRKLLGPELPQALPETTHTPQGDGNRLSIPVTRHLQETTHTPQGDGKPFVFTLQKLLEKPFTSPTGDN